MSVRCFPGQALVHHIRRALEQCPNTGVSIMHSHHPPEVVGLSLVAPEYILSFSRVILCLSCPGSTSNVQYLYTEAVRYYYLIATCKMRGMHPIMGLFSGAYHIAGLLGLRIRQLAQELAEPPADAVPMDIGLQHS
jgi:hypothetical protein